MPINPKVKRTLENDENKIVLPPKKMKNGNENERTDSDFFNELSDEDLTLKPWTSEARVALKEEFARAAEKGTTIESKGIAHALAKNITPMHPVLKKEDLTPMPKDLALELDELRRQNEALRAQCESLKKPSPPHVSMKETTSLTELPTDAEIVVIVSDVPLSDAVLSHITDRLVSDENAAVEFVLNRVGSFYYACQKQARPSWTRFASPLCLPSTRRSPPSSATSPILAMSKANLLKPVRSWTCAPLKPSWDTFANVSISSTPLWIGLAMRSLWMPCVKWTECFHPTRKIN